MIDIRGIKIVVKNNNDEYGREIIFNNNFEVINASNSKGKSTCINSIIYGLGLEELLGDKNQKALKSVVREEFIIDKKKYIVDESYIYVEISNGRDIITVKRYIKSNTIKPELVKVFKRGILTSQIEETTVDSEYMYVHRSGAASSEIGFHKYLEEYLGWKLPHVNSFGDKDVKLYIQTIFSAIFIEQVKGWSDFIGTVPTYFGIKDVKKRVVEFILDMDIMKNEIKNQKLQAQKKEIEKQWKYNYSKLTDEIKVHDPLIIDTPDKPGVIEKDKYLIYINLDNNENIKLKKYIELLENKLIDMNSYKVPNVRDSFENNYQRIEILEDNINILQHKLTNSKKEYNLELFKINSFEDRKKKLNLELNKYKDIQKLSKLGAIMDTHVNNKICPTCHQEISDTLLECTYEENVMSLEENIHYIESEIEMLNLAINNSIISNNQKKDDIIKMDQNIKENINEMKLLRSEILECDEIPSESFITKKIELSSEIELYKKVLKSFQEKIAVLCEISKQWFDLENELGKLPNKFFSDMDEEKNKKLLSYFKANILEFGYESNDIQRFTISNEKGYIPTIYGVNIRLDNSSSDYIRAIWAYTLALFQVSEEVGGNHPGIIIFDEPGQQQMEDESFKRLLEKVASLKNLKCIIGTSFDNEKLKIYNREIDFYLHHICNRAIGIFSN